MPYVNIKITNENPSTTVIVIDEVNTDNWGIAGECITEIRKSNK